MRILLLTPSVRLLGARQSLLALATHLPEGVEPLVVCPSSEGLTQELQRSGIPTRVIPHGAWRKIGGRTRAIFRQIPALRAVVREFRPTIIHANEFHSTPAAVFAAGRRGNRGEKQADRGTVVTSHVRLSITPRQVRNYHLARTARIAAVSAACRDLFNGTGLEKRVRVIHNGVDVSGLAGAERDHSLREKFSWPDDAIVCGLFGLVSPRKNQLVAAEAVAAARKRGADVRLLIAGDAFRTTVSYGEQLRERLAAEDLRDAVQWLPFQEDVAPLYGAIDVNLLISAEEGFGRTIIEAGAVGKPSIGSRIGGIPELIGDGESGWLVDEGNSEQIADILVQASTQRDLLAQRGAEARRRVGEHFTIEAHTKAMITFWQEALEAQGA